MNSKRVKKLRKFVKSQFSDLPYRKYKKTFTGYVFAKMPEGTPIEQIPKVEKYTYTLEPMCLRAQIRFAKASLTN